MTQDGHSTGRGEKLRALAVPPPRPRDGTARRDIDAMLWTFMEQALNGQEMSRHAMEEKVLQRIAFDLAVHASAEAAAPFGAGD